MDSRPENSEPSPYVYSQNTKSETSSVVSYEEIRARPVEEGIEHYYISFNDPQKPQYLYDDTKLKPQSVFKTVSERLLNHKYVLICIVTFTLLTVVTLILSATGVMQISITWNSKPEQTADSEWVFTTLPYESEDWFIPADVWGIKLNYEDCATFKQVTKVTVTQILIDDCDCEDRKSCEAYLKAYVFNQTVLNNGEIEYEFFFGNDVHVFGGRNWNCAFIPGQLRFGYLGKDYDVNDLGKAWSCIYGDIISNGMENYLISPNVCYDIDPKKEKCADVK